MHFVNSHHAKNTTLPYTTRIISLIKRQTLSLHYIKIPPTPPKSATTTHRLVKKLELVNSYLTLYYTANSPLQNLIYISARTCIFFPTIYTPTHIHIHTRAITAHYTRRDCKRTFARWYILLRARRVDALHTHTHMYARGSARYVHAL